MKTRVLALNLALLCWYSPSLAFGETFDLPIGKGQTIELIAKQDCNYENKNCSFAIAEDYTFTDGTNFDLKLAPDAEVILNGLAFDDSVGNGKSFVKISFREVRSDDFRVIFDHTPIEQVDSFSLQRIKALAIKTAGTVTSAAVFGIGWILPAMLPMDDAVLLDEMNERYTKEEQRLRRAYYDKIVVTYYLILAFTAYVPYKVSSYFSQGIKGASPEIKKGDKFRVSIAKVFQNPRASDSFDSPPS